jgi:hypothetical protein
MPLANREVRGARALIQPAFSRVEPPRGVA